MNPEDPIQMSPEDIQKQEYQDQMDMTMEENKRLKDQYGYDSEWIKFLSVLSENDSLKDIVDFIKSTEWTTRQKSKIIAFSKVMLSRGISTTYITGMNDYKMLQDDYTMAECLIPLGMVVYDQTPEFNLLMQMIKMQFNVGIRRSKGGHFIERIGTQRMEVAHDTTNRNPETGFKEKLWQKLGV